MENTRIIYKNYWRDGDIYNYSSQHPQHPVIDSQVDTQLQFYRSRYGSGSGNGRFWIENSNKYIDFDEGGSELTATLTTGEYNGNSLATEIKTQLDSAGGLTYTVTYDEATAKFTISAGSNFTLRWNTGTNKANDISDTCGFDDSADDTGTDTYTSDERRIHYSVEYIDINLETTPSIDFIAILNHNLSSSAHIRIDGADDEDFSTNRVQEYFTYNANNIFYFFDSAETKQYWRLRLNDPTNPNSYIQIGTVVLGGYTELDKAFGKDYSDSQEDLSEGDYSNSLAFYGTKKDSLRTFTLPYIGLNDASKSSILAIQEEAGRIKSFVVCFDYNSPNDNSYYVKFADLTKPVYKHVNNWDWTAELIEVL